MTDRFPLDPNLDPGARDRALAKDAANKRYHERQSENCSWDYWEQAKRDSKREEHGTRTLVRCNLPYDSASHDAHAILANELVLLAGGFTSYVATGAWRNERGETELENVHIYEVSCLAETVAQVRRAFENAGRASGQEWTHITTSEERAHHIKTR